MKPLNILLLCASFVRAAPTAIHGTAAIPVDLTSLYNNRAFGMKAGDASYNGDGDAYPAAYMPQSDFVYQGINFAFPTYKAAGNDNVIATGQRITPSTGKYFSINILASAESAISTANFTANYADGTSSYGTVLIQAWWNGAPSGGNVIFPYHYTSDGVNWNRSMMYYAVATVDSTKDLVSVDFPNVTGGSANSPGGANVNNKLHIFSLSLLPASNTVEKSTILEVQYARTTQKWIEGSDKVQIVEVVVNNIGSGWVKQGSYVTVSVTASGLTTVQPGIIKRLRPGDQARVEVGVVNRGGVAMGKQGNATVRLSGVGVDVTYGFEATFGIKDYEDSFDSVYTHESPSWYSGAKYGIFIHWGVYAVPGWGNSGAREGYAEWYWWDLNKGPSDNLQTYQHHLATYGPNVHYDDFIQNFTASAWDPKEWVDLFADAGAQYFVQVSKHHDGYAIFDLPSNMTERTSVAQFPHRNLLQELFDAAKQYQPHLRRGTYYSLPEWFHPDYKKYGFSLWPGGNATDPFTGETLPYTGYVHVEDYITDIILPSMNTLADMGTEIMWCDIGGPNLTTTFASAWYNTAALTNRQVTMNNRCGLPGDFDTPEYARYAASAPRKWESNLGMDPDSYGYNSATALSSYLSPSGIVTSLIDIVSKNGNFLLDVGPTANGTIIQTEVDNLRAAGVWISDHGEAIFNTTYWLITPEEGDNVRFTTTLDAFYIFSMEMPNGSLVLESPVPWVVGDKVTVVGGGMKGEVVPSSVVNGSLVIDVSEEVAAADQWAWVFKITY